MRGGLELRQALDAADIASVRELFQEYAQALNVDLCFQGFGAELAALPGSYAPPRGRLLLAAVDGAAVGCIALRPLPSGAGEVKRLYVRPAFRGQGIARRLAQTLIAEARSIGYRCLKLDTLAFMDAALALYRSLGFVESGPYYPNPLPGALYLELVLSKESVA